MTALTFDTVAAIAALMSREDLSSIRFSADTGELHITRYPQQLQTAPHPPAKPPADDDEDLLYYSSGG